MTGPTYRDGTPITRGQLVRRGHGAKLWTVERVAYWGDEPVIHLAPVDGYTHTSAMGDQIARLILLCQACQHGTAGHHDNKGCCVNGCPCTRNPGRKPR